jgi:hypothetical protein
MEELKVELNRYDGRYREQAINAESVIYDDQEASIYCWLDEFTEIEIYFDAADGLSPQSVLDTARSLASAIRELDNKVQESCAAECARTGLHPRNFQSELAYIRVDQNRATLRYFGRGVLTEWYEYAEFDGKHWNYLGHSVRGKVRDVAPD